MMARNPGGPTSCPRSRGSIQPACDPFKARPATQLHRARLAVAEPFVESFGSRVRDEVLSVEAFDSVLEAQTVITDWRTIYNHRRPHSSLGWRPPAAYAASLTTNKSEKPARLS